jgi:hypothetical protein
LRFLNESEDDTDNDQVEEDFFEFEGKGFVQFKGSE